MSISFYKYLYQQAKPNLFIIIDSDTKSLTKQYEDSGQIKKLMQKVVKSISLHDLKSIDSAFYNLGFKIGILLLTLPRPYFHQLNYHLRNVFKNANKYNDNRMPKTQKASYMSKHPFIELLAMEYEQNYIRRMAIHYLSEISFLKLKKKSIKPVINHIIHNFVPNPFVANICHIKDPKVATSWDYISLLIALTNILSSCSMNYQNTGLTDSKNAIQKTKLKIDNNSIYSTLFIK